MSDLFVSDYQQDQYNQVVREMRNRPIGGADGRGMENRTVAKPVRPAAAAMTIAPRLPRDGINQPAETRPGIR
jgi:hypothetical protein